MLTHYIGIDIGSQGAICIIEKENRGPSFLSAFPLISGKPDIKAFRQILIDNLDLVKHVVIEDLHSIFGSSSKSNFGFGWINGAIEASLVALELPYTKVQPKRWQKEMWEGVRPVMKPGKKRPTIDTKPTSLLAAQRLFPTVELRKSPKSTKPHDGIVDALLLADYARRHF